MDRIRPLIAFFLLLCFVRVQLPESYILALHHHGHTTDEPAQAGNFRLLGKTLISSQHHHCQTEHLYDVPLLLATPVAVPLPVVVPCFATAPVPTVATAPWIARQPAQLRGPPVG